MTVKQIGLIATARSVAAAPMKYDTEISLRRAGISELSPKQITAMEAWWRIWIANPESDIIAILL